MKLSYFACAISVISLGISIYVHVIAQDPPKKETPEEATDKKIPRWRAQALLHSNNDSRVPDILERLVTLEETVSACNQSSGDESDTAHEEQLLSDEDNMKLEEERIARMEHAVIQRKQTYDDSMKAAVYDSAWDNKMRGNLDDFFEAEIMNTVSDYQFNCKSIMCKLEAIHDDSKKQEEFVGKSIPRIIQKSETDIDGIWQMNDVDEYGNNRTNIYFFKKGNMEKMEKIASL